MKTSEAAADAGDTDAGGRSAGYKDPGAPVEERVRDLLGRMTLREKAAQMTQIERSVASPRALSALAVGSVLNAGGSAPRERATPADWADMVDRFQRWALSSRLGVPMLYATDAVHGHNNLFGATIFPHNVGLGATRDGDLVRRIGEATALEVRASGIPCVFAPCVAGFVISDWEGIDRLCQPHGLDYRYCISASINAGIDMIMVPYRYDKFLEDLLSLVESGDIPITRIDDAVERILRVKFIAGLFEHPFSDRSLIDIVGCQRHRELAREAVRKSLVLLKNGKDPKRPLLPLDKNARRVLVAGTHADDIGYQCGGWTIAWHGRKGKITVGTTILEGIKAAIGKNTEVIYEEFPSETTLADQEISFAVVAVGEVPYAESLGDKTDLSIPFHGAHTILSIARRVPTVVIIVSGRPMILEPELLESVDALVAAWLPGSEGGGVADVVFGDYNFVGLLPFTWFRSVDQLPTNANHELYDPLFPLGFGLRMRMENNCESFH